MAFRGGKKLPIYYYCRHCGVNIGTVDDQLYDDEQLGFQILTEEDRREMISVDASGNIHVKSICDYCYESFLQNPNNHENEYNIH